MAAAAGLAKARTDATTYPNAILAGAVSGLESIETHDVLRRCRLLLNADQVIDGADKAADARVVRELAHIIQLTQAKRLDREAMSRLGSTQALDQTDLEGLALVIHD
jgi:hypothetical protein